MELWNPIIDDAVVAFDTLAPFALSPREVATRPDDVFDFLTGMDGCCSASLRVETEVAIVEAGGSECVISE